MLLRWLIHFWWAQFYCLGFFGIGMGPSSAETGQAGATGALADFATSTGEGDIGLASNFWKSILSGDPSKIASVLGPEISGINKQNQQAKKTASEFGNRGGGTNAGMQAEDQNTRGAYNSLVSQLTSGAAGSLGSLGGGLLSTGLSAHSEAFNMADTIHQQNLSKWNDIFKSITSVASAFLPGGGAGALKSLFGGGGGGGSDIGGTLGNPYFSGDTD